MKIFKENEHQDRWIKASIIEEGEGFWIVLILSEGNIGWNAAGRDAFLWKCQWTIEEVEEK